MQVTCGRVLIISQGERVADANVVGRRLREDRRRRQHHHDRVVGGGLPAIVGGHAAIGPCLVIADLGEHQLAVGRGEVCEPTRREGDGRISAPSPYDLTTVALASANNR